MKPLAIIGIGAIGALAYTAASRVSTDAIAMLLGGLFVVGALVVGVWLAVVLLCVQQGIEQRRAEVRRPKPQHLPPPTVIIVQMPQGNERAGAQEIVRRVQREN